MKELKITWKQFEEDCKKLRNEIGTQIGGNEIGGILAVTRGGLFVAGMLSYLMNIKNIQVINCESYENKEQLGFKFLNIPPEISSKKKILIVDDIIDTGNTIDKIYDYYEGGCIFAIPYYKMRIVKEIKRHFDLFKIKEIDKDTWVKFPWDGE